MPSDSKTTAAVDLSTISDYALWREVLRRCDDQTMALYVQAGDLNDTAKYGDWRMSEIDRSAAYAKARRALSDAEQICNIQEAVTKLLQGHVTNG